MNSQKRNARITRKTTETDITLSLQLDGSGKSEINTGVSFLDHMLQQVAKHGQFDITIECNGDTNIDDHHSVEDIGICFGESLFQSLGDKKGIVRFASKYSPLDEALSRAVIDISGRPGLFLYAEWTSVRINNFDTQLVREFFQGVASAGKITLHLDCIRGINCHHQVESMFKCFALALKEAVHIDTSIGNLKIPSTKGIL